MVFVIHISIWMTNRVNIGFCIAHICTNDYPCYYRFSLCTFLYEWLSMLLWIFAVHISVQMTIHVLIDFCRAYFCTNDHPWYYGFSSWTSQYKWLSILLWVFHHAHLYTNDYFVPNFFSMRFCKTGKFFMFPFFFHWDKHMR